MPKEFQIFYSKKKLIIFMVAALFLVVVAYLLISKEYIFTFGSSRNYTSIDFAISVGIGWGILGLALVALPVLLIRFFKSTPVITISESGIKPNGYQNYHSISWEQVKALEIKKDFIFKHVLVELHRPEDYIAEAKKIKQFAMKSNLKRQGSPVYLNLMVLDIKADELVTACNLFMNARTS